MNHNDNPPAFPCGYHRDGNSADQTGGLTMRDYFAAAAMSSLLKHREAINMLNCVPEFTWQENCANASYKVADAMLLARNPNNPPLNSNQRKE